MFSSCFVDRDIAEFIENKQIKAFEFSQIVEMAGAVIFHRETGHEVRNRHKEDAIVAPGAIFHKLLNKRKRINKIGLT